jgi:hypothetical protein
MSSNEDCKKALKRAVGSELKTYIKAYLHQKQDERIIIKIEQDLSLPRRIEKLDGIILKQEIQIYKDSSNVGTKLRSYITTYLEIEQSVKNTVENISSQYDKAYEELFKTITEYTGVVKQTKLTLTPKANRTPSKDFVDKLVQGEGDIRFTEAIYKWFDTACKNTDYANNIRKKLSNTKAVTIHSNRHTLKPLLSSQDVMPDELSLRLEVKKDPGQPYHEKVVMYHYPKFKNLISRFEFYLTGKRLQMIFARNQIYEFVDDIQDVIVAALMNSNKILVILEDEHMMDDQGELYFAPLVLYKTPSILYTVPDYMTRLPSEHWETF